MAEPWNDWSFELQGTRSAGAVTSCWYLFLRHVGPFLLCQGILFWQISSVKFRKKRDTRCSRLNEPSSRRHISGSLCNCFDVRTSRFWALPAVDQIPNYQVMCFISCSFQSDYLKALPKVADVQSQHFFLIILPIWLCKGRRTQWWLRIIKLIR